MTLKSFGTLGLAIAVLGLIACGKNNNNLKIDGTYRYVETQYPDGVVEKAAGLSILKIENGIGTHYDFTADKKGVETYKSEKSVRGRTLISSKVVESKCSSEEYNIATENIAQAANIELTDKALILTSEGVKTIYEVIPEKDFNTLVAEIKEKNLALGCLDENAVMQKKIGQAGSAIEDEAAQKEEEAEASGLGSEIDTSEGIISLFTTEKEKAIKKKAKETKAAKEKEAATAPIGDDS